MSVNSLQDAIKELYHWQHMRPGELPWFSARLFELMAASDPGNFRRIDFAFPLHAAAFMLWRSSPDPRAFFAAHLPDARLARLDSFVDAVAGKRLTYKRLIA